MQLIKSYKARHGSLSGNRRGGFCIVTVEHPSPGSFIMGRPKHIYKSGQEVGQCVFINEIEPFIDVNGCKKRRAIFQCRCGNLFEAYIHAIKSEHYISCGCFRSEFMREKETTHGMSKHTLYSYWSGMMKRCYGTDEHYIKHYQSRGIIVCDEWRDDPKVFIEYIQNLPDYKVKPEIDRIDNDGNYEPGNIRWATRKEQMNNTRKTNQIKKS